MTLRDFILNESNTHPGNTVLNDKTQDTAKRKKTFYFTQKAEACVAARTLEEAKQFMKSGKYDSQAVYDDNKWEFTHEGPYDEWSDPFRHEDDWNA